MNDNYEPTYEPDSEQASGLVSGSDYEPDSELDPGPDNEPEPGPASESTLGPDCESEPGPASESALGPDCEPEPGPASESTLGPDCESEPGPASESTLGPDCESEPGLASESALGPDNEPEPGLAPGSAHEHRKRIRKKKKRKKKKKGRFRLFFLTIVVLIAGFMLGRISVVRPFMSNGEFDNKAISNKIRTLESYIDTFYLEKYDEEKIEDGIYHGMVTGLGDPYSEYYTSEEYTDMMEGDSGEYRGIGIIVYKDSASGYVTIESVMKDQPAYNAGVENGDIMISVDGKETRELTLTETVGLIKRGKSDTVKLVLLRDNETLEKIVNKTNIVLESVDHEMKEDKIGYISISQFIENTDEQFAAALDDLTRQGMKGLIIDLRDNGGGLVDSCVNMISRIVPQGKLVVYMEDKSGRREDYNSNSPETLDLPIVVLVNGNTASASEIMTGCLKDYDLATVVGSKTYGKGIVQNVMPLGDGSALKLTVAAYYTPKGNNIHKKGIEPDVEIEYTTKEWAKIRKNPSKDKQMKKAVSILEEEIK